MPKKFQSENSKAVAARARKEANKSEDARKKAEAVEEQMWKDDDKHVARKLNRKADKEAKAAEKQERKAELRQLHEEEMDSALPKQQIPEKVTRAEIEARREQAAAAAASGGSSSSSSKRNIEGDNLPALQENLNRIDIEGESASTVEEALSVLGAESSADRHPEKRMRAAYRAYEERELAKLKRELPAMRLSQLKQIVHRNWDKSNENPINQKHSAYNKKCL